MTEYPATPNPNRCPCHPGEVINDIMQDRPDFTRERVAAELGISDQHLDDILAEHKPLTVETALRLAALFGSSAETWLRMQATYDAWYADREK